MKRTPRRRRVFLEDGWSFLRGRVKKAWLRAEIGGGEHIRLPHSWNEEDTWDSGHSSFRGKGGYRCVFHLPDDGRRYRLVAEGYFGLTEIFLDGRKIARVDPQFLGWKIPLDPRMKPGAHLLGLRMDNKFRRGVLPEKRMPDFILHGGLSARVYLEEVPPIHLGEEDLLLRWERRDENWEIGLSGRIEAQEFSEEALEISWAIEDLEGELVDVSNAREIETDPNGLVFSDRLSCHELEPWSPSSPHLYMARVYLWHQDEIIDEVLLRFGLTEAEFRPEEGFFLNGERLELCGVNRHESMPGFGKALPDEIQRLDAESIKNLGANFVRLSHYPQSEVFLDACDELGLMVYAEIATWKSVSSRRSFRSAALRQMESMILRDRHRPSILLWGMGNESRSARAYKELGELIHELDPLRPSIYAENHLYRARRQKTLGLADVWGVNYELDVLDDAREASLLKNVLVSECCNFPHSLRGDEEAEIKQLAVILRDWEIMADHPWIAGYAVWCFADYATEYRRRVHRLAGLFDAWRQPKMAAALFRARHSKKRVLALFVTGSPPEAPPSRFRREIGTKTPEGSTLHLFTNASTLEIRLDEQISTVEISTPHTLLHLPEFPEKIQARAPDSGLQASWRNAGPATRIEISAPESPIRPGATFPIQLRICDAEGIPVPAFSGELRLRVHGPARLRSFNPEGLVKISRGEGRVFITASGQPAEIDIQAAGAGLPSEAVRISMAHSEEHF